MADSYLHGAYGQQQAVGSRVATKSQNAIVYIGTAPVHTLEGGGANVNKPVLVENIAEARKYFGYSDNLADYTLCEAMKVHFEQGGVGPLVFINVLDPAKHVTADKKSKSLTPENGRVVIAGAEKIVLDTVSVKAGSTAKKKGEDYTLRYDSGKKTLTLAEAVSGALGTSVLTIEYKEIDPSAVRGRDWRKRRRGSEHGRIRHQERLPADGLHSLVLAGSGLFFHPRRSQRDGAEQPKDQRALGRLHVR